MELKRADREDVTVIKLSGKLMGGPDATVLNETLHELIEDGKKKVVLDLGGVDWINSSGLGILISGLTTVRNAGGQLSLAATTDRLMNLLEITKLSSIFDTYVSVDAAVGKMK